MPMQISPAVAGRSSAFWLLLVLSHSLEIELSSLATQTFRSGLKHIFIFSDSRHESILFVEPVCTMHRSIVVRGTLGLKKDSYLDLRAVLICM